MSTGPNTRERSSQSADQPQRFVPAGHERHDCFAPGQTYASVSDQFTDIVLTRPTSPGWVGGFLLASALLMLFLYGVGYFLILGVGIWGVNIPVAWGFAILNYVWWIGIGHAGALISAILLLLYQKWRRSVSRLAEAMTLFAVTCASLFPLLHLGRPWFFYWLLPYPNSMGVWPQFRGPLVWDVFAILVHFLVSLMIWYVGMIPDLATLRDRARTRTGSFIYGALALGWRGEAEHWHRYKVTYLLLAGLATPMIVVVHSIVAYDFAVTILPGWHTTLFPPYFVAGAMLSGFAMLFVLVIPLRPIYRLEGLITERHLHAMGKIMLATSLIVGFSYFSETFMAWYGGNQYKWRHIEERLFGSHAVLFWIVVVCNVIVPQALWSAQVRTRPVILWIIGLIVLIGVWLERYMIVILGLEKDFLPSSWGPYSATFWDWATFIGTFGLFLVGLFLFLRFLPMVSIHEVHPLLEPPKPDRERGGE